MIDRDTRHELPVMSATRTLMDIAWATQPHVLTAAVDSAVRDGLTSDDFLYRRIIALRRQGRAGLNKLLAVVEGAEIIRGGASWLEREMLRLFDRAALPRPATQVVLGRRRDRLIRVDFHFPGTPVVVEALGYRWHRSTNQMTIDAERINALILQGLDPYQFTYEQVVLHPDDVARTVRAALSRYESGAPVSA